MIDVALNYVRQILDQHLVARLGIDGSVVVLNSLSNPDSSQTEKNRNKMVITLVNLDYETNRQFYGAQQRDLTSTSQLNPAVYFNLDILVAAHFDDYGEALKILTASIAFFQENAVLDRVNHPGMPEGIPALKFEIENSPFAKSHNLWTTLGVSYLPSIIYKIRHVTVQSGQIKGVAANVNRIAGVALP